MNRIQLFHATLDGARELEETPFRREKDLQGFIEMKLNELFGIDFLDTEHSTGPHDKQRIDSLGIDSKGRPVVVEYKLRSDKNIINQGLGYLDWLGKNPDSIELLVIKKIDQEKAKRIDMRNPRLLCIAGAFTRNDIVTAENCKASVELVRYCRYGDSDLLLEWVYGETVVSKPKPPPKPDPVPTRPDDEPDYRKYQYWEQLKANPEKHSLFVELRDYAFSLGNNVLDNPTTQYISFKTTHNVAYVFYQKRLNRLKVFVCADLERTLLREDFMRELPEDNAYPPCNAQLFIYNQSDLEEAKLHLLHSYNEAG